MIGAARRCRTEELLNGRGGAPIKTKRLKRLGTSDFNILKRKSVVVSSRAVIPLFSSGNAAGGSPLLGSCSCGCGRTIVVRRKMDRTRGKDGELKCMT